MLRAFCVWLQILFIEVVVFTFMSALFPHRSTLAVLTQVVGASPPSDLFVTHRPLPQEPDGLPRLCGADLGRTALCPLCRGCRFPPPRQSGAGVLPE